MVKADPSEGKEDSAPQRLPELRFEMRGKASEMALPREKQCN